MLLELAIADFAIIERTTIRFTEGLNVLTGETGAGKSILLDALGAVLGARVSADLVRNGARLARVEAAFDLADTHGRLDEQLAELGFEPERGEPLILTREILANGRSSARISGRMTTASELARLGISLVDIHGQSDHLAILKTSEQRDLLDRFAGLESERSSLASQVREWRSIRTRLAEISRDERSRAQHIDLLRFQIDEIDAAALSVQEEEQLVAERDVLRNADRLRADALEALSMLAEDDIVDNASVSSRMRALVSRAEDIATLDPASAELAERANEVLVLVEDLSRDLRSYAESVESNEQRLVEVEERLDAIQSLKRKYGPTINDVLAFGESARQELAGLSSEEFDLDALTIRLEALERSLSDIAVALSESRSHAAVGLARAIEQSIRDLNLRGAQLQINVEHRADTTGIPIGGLNGSRRVHIDDSGIDVVEFRIAPNAGEALKPLARIASGGETARLMLATKSILSKVDLTPTLVFDEIDVGVGGRSGQVVGEKLWGISSGHQVIVITHLPQIAAFAATHLKIEKHESSGRTVSEVRTLDETEREEELAAMLDGLPITHASRANAREMLERSRSRITSPTA
jgi:DNA repair protein RecN (Recombination protein N)